jgi:hypothetical protein
LILQDKYDIPTLSVNIKKNALAAKHARRLPGSEVRTNKLFHTVALHDMNQVPVTKIDTVNVTQIELVQEEYKITEI